MTVGFRPLSDKIGAQVLGVDLSRPVNDETFARVRQALLDFQVLAFPRQTAMTPRQQVAFSERFGPLDVESLPEFALPGHPEVFVASNVRGADGTNFGQAKSGRKWHSDLYFLARPAVVSFLHGKEIPPAQGDTLFANMHAVHEAMPAGLKRRLEGLRVRHSRIRAWPHNFPDRPPLTEAQLAALPDVVHPLVRIHPETGRKSLYAGSLYEGDNPGWSIEGWSDSHSQALYGELRAFALQDRFVYAYRWKPGDALLWDNRCTMHCATPFDEDAYRRVMYRTTVKGDLPAAA